MTAVGGVGGVVPPTRHEQLRQAAIELESVFYAQLFAVMRESLPDGGGLVERSSGEKMFTAMLDEQVARAAAARHAGGLADAMARQLGRHLPPEDATPSAAPAAGSVDVRSR